MNFVLTTKTQRMSMVQAVKRMIGLTGGIASGKSSVSSYLHNTYDLPILDADIYAREAVKDNSPILAAIFSRYGEAVQLAGSQLNRTALAEIIFNDKQEKQWLESQIHPYVKERFIATIKRLSNPIIVLVIPLLFEANMVDLVTEIWVVSCSPDEQSRRLLARNGLTKEQAIARINNQLPIEKKIAAADVVLDNSSTLPALYQQIDNIMKRQ